MSVGNHHTDFDPVAAMEATRPMVMGELLKRFRRLLEMADHWDSECDRALTEIWWLTRWIEGRATRNQSEQN